MKKTIFSAIFITGLITVISFRNQSADEWVSLFNGTSLDGWKVGANPETFSVENGMIKVNGKVAHLFYDGPVANHQFTDFELMADVKTLPGSNSGIYFDTEYQESSWPKKGYEVQVNNSHTDWRRTGGLYAVQDVKENFAKDDEWFTMQIKVFGKKVQIWVNKKLVTDYTEPSAVTREEGMEARVIAPGTIALQGHDPKSTVYYKNIKIRQL